MISFFMTCIAILVAAMRHHVILFFTVLLQH